MKRKSLRIVCSIAFPVILSMSFKTISFNAMSLKAISFKALPFKSSRANSPLRSEDPWKPAQLLAPGDLAKTMGDPQAKQPFVFCVGPGALIKGSIDLGQARDSSHLNKFRQELSKLPKDATIVIYCGCCPFEHCPNIRPAFTLLNEMKFTHPQLLNLEHNLKTDWIAKGYPVTK